MERINRLNVLRTNLDTLMEYITAQHGVPIDRGIQAGMYTIRDTVNECSFNVNCAYEEDDWPFPVITMHVVDIRTHAYDHIFPYGMNVIKFDAFYDDCLRNFGSMVYRVVARVALIRDAGVM